MNETKSSITGWNCSVVGFGYFLSKPKLWLVPFLTTLLCWLFLVALFVCVAFFSWPSSHLSWSKYTLKMFEALGMVSAATLVAWAFVVPGFLNWAFEKMIRKILLSKGEVISDRRFYSSFFSGFYVVWKTIIWRVVWVVLAVVFALFFGPVGMLISQVAFGHVAMLDACDLSLTIQGVKGKKRYDLLKENTLGILSGGFIGGLLSFILLPTVIGWIFWLPGMYVGATLWTRFWELD